MWARIASLASICAGEWTVRTSQHNGLRSARVFTYGRERERNLWMLVRTTRKNEGIMAFLLTYKMETTTSSSSSAKKPSIPRLRILVVAPILTDGPRTPPNRPPGVRTVRSNYTAPIAAFPQNKFTTFPHSSCYMCDTTHPARVCNMVTVHDMCEKCRNICGISVR